MITPDAVRPSGTGRHRSGAWRTASAGNRNGYLLYLLPEPQGTDSARSAFEYDQIGNENGVWGPVPAESTWAHLAAVFSNGTAMYVDGTLEDTAAVATAITARTGSFTVGRAADEDHYYFKGAVDELAVYPRALSLATIVAHAAFRE